MGAGVAWGKGLLDKADNVFHFDLPLVPTGLDGIPIHRHILGTGDDKVLYAIQGNGLADAILARPLFDPRLLHPDAPAPGPATQTAVTVARHLDHPAAKGGPHPAR